MTPLSPRCYRSLFIFLIALILIPLAPQFVHGQSIPPTPSEPPLSATDQQQFLSYWTTETGWRTELQLRNNQVSQILTVTPVLRAGG
jgi:maltodextrin utilization protein YvdJ